MVRSIVEKVGRKSPSVYCNCLKKLERNVGINMLTLRNLLTDIGRTTSQL